MWIFDINLRFVQSGILQANPALIPEPINFIGQTKQSIVVASAQSILRILIYLPNSPSHPKDVNYIHLSYKNLQSILGVENFKWEDGQGFRSFSIDWGKAVDKIMTRLPYPKEYKFYESYVHSRENRRLHGKWELISRYLENRYDNIPNMKFLNESTSVIMESFKMDGLDRSHLFVEVMMNTSKAGWLMDNLQYSFF